MYDSGSLPGGFFFFLRIFFDSATRKVDWEPSRRQKDIMESMNSLYIRMLRKIPNTWTDSLFGDFFSGGEPNRFKSSFKGKRQIKIIFGESIELTFETNLKPWCFVLPVALTNRSSIGSLMFSLAVGLKDLCLRCTTSHGVLKDTFQHFLSLLRSHEGGHLHSHRPRRSDVLIFYEFA